VTVLIEELTVVTVRVLVGEPTGVSVTVVIGEAYCSCCESGDRGSLL